jgi:hypothetical protein
MESAESRYPRRQQSDSAQVSRSAVNLIWQVLQIPFATVLVLLEPIVAFVLAGLAILGVIAALFRAMAGVGSNVAVWAMLALSGGSLLLLAIYYALIRLFTRP